MASVMKYLIVVNHYFHIKSAKYLVNYAIHKSDKEVCNDQISVNNFSILELLLEQEKKNKKRNEKQF